MKKITAITSFLAAMSLLFAASTSAEEHQAKWIRHSSISPDGQTIAFAYQGDIYTVPVAGGKATQLTTNPSYDGDPVWSSDGKSVVFSSYRELCKDIWAIDADGGNPRRLTTYSGADTPLAVTKDNEVLFSSPMQFSVSYSDLPSGYQLYKVPVAGGKVSQVLSLTVSNVSVNADGAMLYEDYKGYEDPLRKHHTSSVTRDIWYVKDGAFTKLSTFNGEDRNPLFAPDGDSYYYLSERSGSFNVWRSSVSHPEANDQVTSFATHPVRFASISADGTLLFSWNGDLYTLKPGQSAPQVVDIMVAKDKNSRDTIRRGLDSGASAIAVSPDGKEIAVVVRGDVYVTGIEYNTVKRITDTPQQERGVCFAPDGRTLYYAAERDGEWAIWKTELTNKDDKYFTWSYDFKESRVTEPGHTCMNPVVSPDGKMLAYFQDRTDIRVINIKNGKEKCLVKDIVYSYSDGDHDFAWSPDSQYILTDDQRCGRWNNNDVSVINVDNGEVTDLTQSGYSDGAFRWAMGGKAMTWESDKAGYRSHGSWGAEGDIYAMFFDANTYMEFVRDREGDEIDKIINEDSKKSKKEEKDTAKADDNKVEKLKLNFEGREDRIVRLTRTSGNLGDHYLTPDGSKLYYVMSLERGSDLLQLDIKKGDIKVIQKGFNGSFVPDKDGKYIYVNTGSGVTRLEVASGQTKQISFSGEYNYRPAEEREYIFWHAWKQVSEKFYDETIRGIDWKGYGDNYASFLPYIDNNFDFQDLLSEMLGELNGSHTGARYYPTAGRNTGRIGVLYDEAFAGRGLRIAEVLDGGPLAIADPDVKAGDIITAIDGVPVKEGDTWYDLFSNKSGKRLQLTIKHGSKENNILVVATSSDATLLYNRWVKQREQLVEKLSGGRVGYVHVKGMNSPSFREVYSKLLGKYRNCEAVIVDTRHNGGGWLHDDLATLLGGKAYVDFMPRGQYIGTEPYSKWNKPSCVVMGEDNYSDASGFPYTYRALGIGKLIGAPVPGTMTAVWWEYQIDPTLVFGIPEVTSVGRAEGRPLENLQIEPDILVYNDPASVLRGEDKQIEAAVAEMLREIDETK